LGIATQIDLYQAVLVSMPSIEGSFGVAYGKGPHGWDSEEVAACKLAAGVLNALESYFWVRFIPDASASNP
jgi:hypothetical protein